MTEVSGARIAVECGLNRNGVPYSNQEDIVLKVTLTNQEPRRVIAPDLAQSRDVKLRLKRPGVVASLEVATLVPRPGIAVPSATRNLEPGQSVTSGLLLQAYVGSLRDGEYELQLSLKAPEWAFDSPWLRFTVLPLEVTESATGYSAASQPGYLDVTWIDASVTPSRLLLRRYQIGSKEVASFTVQLDDVAGGVVGRASPLAPPGVSSARGWYAWSTGKELKYLLSEERTVLERFTLPLEPASRIVGPALVYPDPTTDETGFSLLLLSEDTKAPAFIGLEVDPRGKKVAARTHRLTEAPTNVSVTHESPKQRWIAWTIGATDGSRAEVRLLPWTRESGFGNEVKVLDVDSRILSLDLKMHDGKLRLAVFAYMDPRRSPGSSYAGGALLSSVIVTSEGAPHGGKATVRPERLSFEPRRCSVAIGDDGTACFLASDGARVWIGGRASHDARPVATCEKATHESLFVQWDSSPRVLFLDPTQGWRIAKPAVTP